MVIPTSCIWFNPPEPFDGSPSKYKDWICQLVIFICRQGVIEDDWKILLALSYVRTGIMAIWAAAFMYMYLAVPNLGTWAK
jgi:hypothetical protein